MSTAFALSSLCAKCFQPVSSSSGGYILSCSDFLCLRCSDHGRVHICPACGKQPVQLLDITQSLPEEVSGSLADPVQHLETTTTTVKFQIKYYKQIIKKLLAKISQLGKENAQLKQNGQRTVETPRPPTRASPFFQDSEPIPESRPSFNQVLTNPINPTALAQRPPLTPMTSQSILSKRPAAQFPQPSFNPAALDQPSAKRTQWSFSRPPTSLPVSSPGTSTLPPPATPRLSSHGSPAGTAPQWGFGVPVSQAARSATPMPRQEPQHGHGLSPGQESTGSRPNTSASVTQGSFARPPSSQRPPPFVTPSRLRSPHPSVPRTGSGGGAGTSSARRAHPLQGIGVTLSQQQPEGGSPQAGERTLHGFLRTADGYRGQYG